MAQIRRKLGYFADGTERIKNNTWSVFDDIILANLPVLLAGGYFLLGRFSRTQVIDTTENSLKAQAEVVAAL